MIIHGKLTLFGIYCSKKLSLRMQRKLFYKMDNQVILFFGVQHTNLLSFGLQPTCISYLTSTLRIKRSFIQDELESIAFLIRDGSVLHDLCIGFQCIVAHKFHSRIFMNHYPISCILLRSSSRSGLLFFHFFSKAFFIY